MPTVVVPFRRESAKLRLHPLPEEARAALAEAMLADVLAAAETVGTTIVASEPDQGEAVELALRGVESGLILIVNADLPCAQPRDLFALLGALPDAVLAGGLGGSRFARALTETLAPGDVTVVGNVGDDLEVAGLHVSPDLDTILYTLAGVLDEKKGWGRAGETWNARDAATQLGEETWFQLGDRDLGPHLSRTEALRRGEPLSAVTARLARVFGVEATLLPATDDRLRTWIATPAGEFTFQEWFVRRQHRDEVDGVRFEGAEQAAAAPGVLAALEAADLIAIAPSNPFVSIGPILAVAEIRDALERRRVPAVAVSPLIGGRTVRGPADRMLARLAGGTGPAQVTQCYQGSIDVLVVDEPDADEAAGIPTIVTRTLMSDAEARRRLAEAVLA